MYCSISGILQESGRPSFSSRGSVNSHDQKLADPDDLDSYHDTHSINSDSNHLKSKNDENKIPVGRPYAFGYSSSAPLTFTNKRPHDDTSESAIRVPMMKKLNRNTTKSQPTCHLGPTEQAVMVLDDFATIVLPNGNVNVMANVSLVEIDNPHLISLLKRESDISLRVILWRVVSDEAIKTYEEVTSADRDACILNLKSVPVKPHFLSNQDPVKFSGKLENLVCTLDLVNALFDSPTGDTNFVLEFEITNVHPNYYRSCRSPIVSVRYVSTKIASPSSVVQEEPENEVEPVVPTIARITPQEREQFLSRPDMFIKPTHNTSELIQLSSSQSSNFVLTKQPSMVPSREGTMPTWQVELTIEGKTNASPGSAKIHIGATARDAENYIVHFLNNRNFCTLHSMGRHTLYFRIFRLQSDSRDFREVPRKPEPFFRIQFYHMGANSGSSSERYMTVTTEPIQAKHLINVDPVSKFFKANHSTVVNDATSDKLSLVSMEDFDYSSNCNQLRLRVEAAMERRGLSMEDMKKLLCLPDQNMFKRYMQNSNLACSKDSIIIEESLRYWLRDFNNPKDPVATLDASERCIEEVRLRLTIWVIMKRCNMTKEKLAKLANLKRPYVLYRWLEYVEINNVLFCEMSLQLCRWFHKEIQEGNITKDVEPFSSTPGLPQHLLNHFHSKIQASDRWTATTTASSEYLNRLSAHIKKLDQIFKLGAMKYTSSKPVAKHDEDIAATRMIATAVYKIGKRFPSRHMMEGSEESRERLGKLFESTFKEPSNAAKKAKVVDAAFAMLQFVSPLRIQNSVVPTTNPRHRSVPVQQPTAINQGKYVANISHDSVTTSIL